MTHPNIIKIICHDIGKHLGCYGVKSVSTKAIDALAKNGILFENSYATSPGCSPSRAAIATGLVKDAMCGVMKTSRVMGVVFVIP